MRRLARVGPAKSSTSSTPPATSGEAQAGPAAAPVVHRREHVRTGLLLRGRYRIISELGAGAYGTVCLAEDESTSHHVAIRFLPREVADTPQAAETVLRRGQSIVAASITHPGLVRVLEFGEVDDGRPFAVMELLEGFRLSEILSEGKPLDIAAALCVALDLGGAVDALHSIGLTHLALCPRNVMVFGDGRVKLMDVELAGLREGRELQGTTSAEPPAEYLSPEQILLAPVSQKTDVYAYGAILYELLCGTPPFEATTREALLTKHLKEGPVPVRWRRHDVPGPVEHAVALALHKQPEPRPTMGDVLNLLWAGAHGPAARRKRVGVVKLAGGAVGALAVVALVWGVFALRPSAPPPLARPPAPPLTERATLRPPAAPSAPAADTGAALTVTPATPSAGLPSSMRATLPPPPAPASAPPRVERLERPRTPKAPATRAPERPSASDDADDPRAVIDWLLRNR